MAIDVVTETAMALQQDWGLTVSGPVSEETILRLLADRVVVLVEKGADAFYQMMYRLDISEKKLNAIIAIGGIEMPRKIARLIYDRQLQKIVSRRENTPPKVVEDPEMDW